MVLIIVVIIVALVFLFVVATYNNLVRRRNQVDNAWAQIDVQLRRRYDLIANLVDTVKGYAGHERQTFDSVTQARTAAIAAQGPAQQAQAENVLTGTLRSLFAVAEAYPQLKANQNFLELQGELSDTETKVATSRQFYNDAVVSYNTGIQTLPGAAVAGVMRGRFATREYFEETGEARGSVAVRF